MRYQLRNAFIVAAELESVWTFFSSAENLPKITPPQMRFRIDTPMPIELRKDAIVDYTIRIAGVPLRWKTRIVNWEPPHRFIDLQQRGPYKLWHHEHTFEAVDGGVLCRDRVTYEIPLGIVGRIAQLAMVRRQLVETFTYRNQMLEKLLAPIQSLDDGLTISRLKD